MRARTFFAALFLILLAARLCHVDILWAEEDLPMAAAAQTKLAKTLYRDVWFDKPPLLAYIYLLWGAHIGVPLRIAGAAFVFLCCLAAWKFARELWGLREGLAAALALGFFLTFGIPSAVMALAPDLLMILPHFAAVYLAWRGRVFWSGLLAGAVAAILGGVTVAIARPGHVHALQVATHLDVGVGFFVRRRKAGTIENSSSRLAAIMWVVRPTLSEIMPATGVRNVTTTLPARVASNPTIGGRLSVLTT